MKRSHLLVGALILCSNLFAQPKGVDMVKKELFTRKVHYYTLVKNRFKQKYFYITEATSFGRLALLKELKKVLSEYDKCFELPDLDYSVGFEEVNYGDVTKIISKLYQGGNQLEYFFLIGEYSISIMMGDVFNSISISKLNEKDQISVQNNIEQHKLDN